MTPKLLKLVDSGIFTVEIFTLKTFNIKNLHKVISVIIILFSFMACSQINMKSLHDAKTLEINKKDFIGKPLSFLLQNINAGIKSIIPVPNKNRNEINRISFLFVSKSTYKNSYSENTGDGPTRITVNFNQNAEFLGERCTYDKTGCTEWTKEDEKNMGDLIVYDIYVSGKN